MKFILEKGAVEPRHHDEYSTIIQLYAWRFLDKDDEPIEGDTICLQNGESAQVDTGASVVLGANHVGLVTGSPELTMCGIIWGTEMVPPKKETRIVQRLINCSGRPFAVRAGDTVAEFTILPAVRFQR